MPTKTDRPPTATQEAAEAEALNIFEQLQALGDSVQVAIFREPGRRFLETVGPDGLDEGMMRERYGGGKFSLHTRDMSNKFVKGQPIRHTTIEGEPKMFPPAPAGADPVAAAEVGRLRGELDALKSIPAPNGNGSDGTTMLAIVTLLAPAVTAMLESIVNRPAPPPPPDPMAMLGEFRKMVRDDRKEQAAQANGGDSMDPLLEKLGIPLLGEVTKLRKVEEGKAAAPAQLAAPPPPKPKTYPELAAFIARWCAEPCARGTDPQLRAELFLEELTLQETELYASVIELARMPDILELWIKLVPEIGLNREWHGTFIDEIRLLASDEEEPAEGPEGDGAGSPDPEGGRGDEGDVGGDGEAGEAGGGD